MSNHLIIVNKKNLVVEVHACFCKDKQEEQFFVSCEKYSDGQAYDDNDFDEKFIDFDNGVSICVVNV